MKILAIETSCDETAAAVISVQNGNVSVSSNIVSSQVKLHAPWGGVVPNLAAREHLRNIIPVVSESLRQAKASQKDIALLAVTSGPGLIPALLIGLSSAKTLSYLWNKPLMGIHHIEGHIYANFIARQKDIKFPLLCLVVSGGHTQLVIMERHLSYKIVGQTLDDAAGEAFDKVARILELGYPGGPIISELAGKFKKQYKKYQLIGSPLPRPMINKENLNFSFSGLKTAVLYAVKKNKSLLKNKRFKLEMSHEFQQAVVDVLVSKTIKAAKKYNPRTICIAGGVSANKELRNQLRVAINRHLPKISFQLPEIKYSIDNAAMIATAAYFRQKFGSSKDLTGWGKTEAQANLTLK